MSNLSKSEIKRLDQLKAKRAELAKLLPFAVDDTGKGCVAHPLYQWQLDYIESPYRYNYICAANQIGKSAANWIRKLRFNLLSSYWDKFFGGEKPLPFWYFYPSSSISTAEIKTKYVRRYLPDESLKKHPRWGYKIEESKGVIEAIHFNVGTSNYYKFYSQPPSNLQTATLSGIFADEEMPKSLFDELNFRGVSRDHFYFNNVFTATIGQEYLRRTIEVRGDGELMPDAFKRQISMYDCLNYADGKPSTIWTEDKIAKVIASCTSPEEVQRRVFGRFVLSENRKFHSFNHDRNTSKGRQINNGEWLVYGGLDWGSGGASGHPSSALYLAVSKDFKKGRIFKAWRGDGISTTQGDLVAKHMQLSKGLNLINAAYDYSASDIGTIASRIGIPLVKADKSRDSSIELINTLFKNGQLVIYIGEGYEENEKLISEILSARDTGPKANDDLIDALRYCVNLVPWQFEIQEPEQEAKAIEKKRKLSARERFWKYGHADEMFEYDAIDEAIDYYDDLMEMYEL